MERVILSLLLLSCVGCAPPASTLPPPVHTAIIVYGFSSGKEIKRIPVDREAVEHPPIKLPLWFRQMHPNTELRLLYKLCLGEDGRVSDVSALRGIKDLDDGIMQQMRDRWTYRVSIKQCFVEQLVFRIE
jgi:hypothetical protein